jgi:hypothetical protein
VVLQGRESPYDRNAAKKLLGHKLEKSRAGEN